MYPQVTKIKELIISTLRAVKCPVTSFKTRHISDKNNKLENLLIVVDDEMSTQTKMFSVV